MITTLTMATLDTAADGLTVHPKDVKDSGSLINTIIPDLVKRRAGRLPSIRRAFSTAALDKQHAHSPPSPPPPYVGPQRLEIDDASDVEDEAMLLDRRSIIAGHTRDTVLHAANESSRSGVRWKHVIEGCRLVECAGREAIAQTEDPELTRKMYIDGVSYLMKALPDLSTDESSQLSNFLPTALKSTTNEKAGEQLHFLDRSEDAQSKNYVHQFMTTATMYGVLLASVALPLLKRFIAVIYRCDRHYNISSRVASTMSQTVSVVAGKVYTSLNEGKTGQYALGMTLYTLEGVSSGILEGYSQAMKWQGVMEMQCSLGDGEDRTR